MGKWIIEDWMGKRCYRELEFDSFDDARDFICEVADEEAYKVSKDYDSTVHEDIYNGICEDLYATEKEVFYA